MLFVSALVGAGGWSPAPEAVITVRPAASRCGGGGLIAPLQPPVSQMSVESIGAQAGRRCRNRPVSLGCPAPRGGRFRWSMSPPPPPLPPDGRPDGSDATTRVLPPIKFLRTCSGFCLFPDSMNTPRTGRTASAGTWHLGRGSDNVTAADTPLALSDSDCLTVSA